MELLLTDEEKKFLANILEQQHRALLNEIAHTDDREFRRGLRRDEKILDSLIDRLRGAAVLESHG